MAKRAAKKPPTEPAEGEKAKVKREKECPSCHKIVHNAVRTCPHCSHEFVPKTKKAGKAASGLLSELDFAVFALESGGIEQAKARIEKLKTNPVMEFTISAGGIDQALTALEKLKGKFAKTA